MKLISVYLKIQFFFLFLEVHIEKFNHKDISKYQA